MPPTTSATCEILLQFLIMVIHTYILYLSYFGICKPVCVQICHLSLICSDISTHYLLLASGLWTFLTVIVCCPHLNTVNQPPICRPAICPPLHQWHLADNPRGHTECNVFTVPRLTLGIILQNSQCHITTVEPNQGIMSVLLLHILSQTDQHKRYLSHSQK